VVNNSSQAQNLVSFTQFAADLAGNQLPNFSYIVPSRLILEGLGVTTYPGATAAPDMAEFFCKTWSEA
jgi:hypothetical protein